MSRLTKDQLARIMPNLPAMKRAEYFPPLTAGMDEFEITTDLRMAAYLAQLAHESGELRYMEEIASGAAYEGRRDLGNTEPGDGVRFKGRGPLQLTGRANYEAYGDALGVDLVNNPPRAADPDVAFRVAGRYWQVNQCNGFADLEDFESITRRINGGLNGLADRERYYAVAKRVLAASPPAGQELPAQPPPPAAPPLTGTVAPPAPTPPGSGSAAVPVSSVQWSWLDGLLDVLGKIFGRKA